ncbi:MAG TPA: sterol carrier family protein [Jiangellales bacterium]|nr:sterol carrier family protein [Jiangellales bacterium]
MAADGGTGTVVVSGDAEYEGRLETLTVEDDGAFTGSGTTPRPTTRPSPRPSSSPVGVGADRIGGMAPRRTDPATARAMYEAAHVALRAWLAALPAEAWARSSVLAGWSVSDIGAHLVLVADSVTALTPAPRSTRPLSLAAYVATYPAAAEAIAERTRAAAGGPDRSPAQLLDALDERFVEAVRALDGLGAGDLVVAAGRGPIRLGDFLATRVVELVVHGDDLTRSCPDLAPPVAPREPERLAVRVLLEALAERTPGRSLEVRVPPYAAVQCVAGPRHTRGTPPGVVETEPVTWLRLAAGRVGWAEARESVRASGERADLSPYLPLF